MIKYKESLDKTEFKGYIDRLIQEMSAETDYIYMPIINEQRENGIIKSMNISIERQEGMPNF